MANSFLTTIQHDLLVQSIGYTSTKSCHPHDEDEEMYVFKTQEQEKEECKVSQITFAKKFITEQDIAHLLLEENEEQAMADAFSEESDMFKNTALYFTLYVLMMVTLFTVLNACIFGLDRLW